ncbi:IS1182 family transposase [Bacillus sp. T33-2]|uniref:IS1182 family transposase n=1 Tax=Bacillus sp. T33-2 TaxID=2054168 RepID=UPI000C78DF87|nr:IS1182 family transposase [Bacillus sp. T33-2]PLR93298.1 IS5/IS1182 family transposase [Bacillus sp. T33-2]
MLPKKELKLSSYSELYNILIPKDHFLRKFNDLVDFEFIYDELKDMYTEAFGATAKCPIMMFKLLLLKVMYPMSDRDLIERATFDMSFKYFLDVAPEDKIVHPTSLTKFRRLRLKDASLLDVLIKKTVEIALEKGLIKSNQIIVDSTHTNSMFNSKSPVEILQEQSKQLRKSVYKLDEKYKEKMPAKPNTNDLLDHINYCTQLIKVIKNDEKLYIKEDVKLKAHLLEETVNDDIEQLNSTVEKDAKVGHKSSDSSFFGYKTHIAMVPERIVTSAVVTTGEQNDGKHAQELIEKSVENGIEVKALVGDGAYSEKEMIEYAKEKEFKLVSKLSKTVSEGHKRASGEFYYNKDAGRYVCTAGHMAVKKALHGKKKHAAEGTVLRETHYFDIEKCKVCPLREGCYKEGAASKTYTVTLKKDKIHEEHQLYQETDEFKELAKNRYMIEAKNAELKNRHGFKKSHSHGLLGMHIQSATTIFVVNMKRIITIMGQ